MSVEKDKLDAVRNVGRIVAKISENNASPIYKLDKVRTINEFWSVLREISRKLPSLNEEKLKKIKPTALDEVIQLTKEIVERNKDGWREVRDLIVVYASMYYSLDKLGKRSEGGEGDEGY